MSFLMHDRGYIFSPVRGLIQDMAGYSCIIAWDRL